MPDSPESATLGITIIPVATDPPSKSWVLWGIASLTSVRIALHMVPTTWAHVHSRSTSCTTLPRDREGLAASLPHAGPSERALAPPEGTALSKPLEPRTMLGIGMTREEPRYRIFTYYSHRIHTVPTYSHDINIFIFLSSSESREHGECANNPQLPHAAA